MKKRAFFLLKLYLTLVVIFIIAKLFFMDYNHAGHNFGGGDVFRVIAHGLTLDLSTSIYFCLLPYILVVVSLWWNGWGVIRKILKVYSCIMAAAFALIFTADTSLYEFWRFKLDSSVFQYIDTTGDAFASVSVGYILVRLLVILVAGYAIYKVIVWVTPRQLARTPLKVNILGSVVALLLVGPIVIGIRGGTSESTTNIGQVYYSSNQFLNHSAVNPVFSFMSSFVGRTDDNTVYHFFEERKCRKLIKDVYQTASVHRDTLLNTRRPNVLIIIMESCGGEFTEIGGRKDVMPNLNRIAHEGIYFTNCYGNSYRTDRGTVCLLSGYPSFPQTSIMKVPSKSRSLPSIARSLVKKGYATDFLYGGDIDFTNMRSYLLGTGYQKIFSKENYTLTEQESSKWGVRDDITFETMFQNIIRRDGRKRWISTFLTLSSHEPWTVPIHRFSDIQLNSFAYLDDCIGNLIGRLKRTPQWKDLLIIMLPDHGIIYKNLEESAQLRNHIPMIWTGGAVKSPYIVSQICNQSDLAATLLGQMGITHREFTFSRDVTSSTYCYPIAIHTYNNGFSIVDSTGFTVYDLNSNQTVTATPHPNQHRIDIGKAILQTTSKDLHRR